MESPICGILFLSIYLEDNIVSDARLLAISILKKMLNWDFSFVTFIPLSRRK